ncbi:hypothetical protein BH09PSE4_BH09PSE4_21450 [soil metagenome]
MKAFLPGLAALALPSALAAQQAAPPPAHSDAQPDDVVVEGQLDLPNNPDTVTRPSIANAQNPQDSAVANRAKFEFSERIAKCVARGKLSTRAQLRAVLDDAPNKATQVYAQDRLKRSNVTCSEGTELRYFSEPNLGYSIYDRGAYMIEAINTYAPDLKLTSRDTGDPAVQARFNTRETPLSRYRLPVDYRYFEIAVCMVRIQPRLSLRLVRTSGPSKQISRIASAIVDNAHICVGDAKRVYFDPTQFRMYIADAVYRWGVAKLGVNTLIPD